MFNPKKVRNQLGHSIGSETAPLLRNCEAALLLLSADEGAVAEAEAEAEAKERLEAALGVLRAPTAADQGRPWSEGREPDDPAEVVTVSWPVAAVVTS